MGPELILDVVRQAVAQFQLHLDELHNDSTTISFYGNYPDAVREGLRQGRKTHAITWEHSKDHRPDLKQLLYILTVTEDGGVPVYFTTASGNVSDDRTHTATWDLLCQLAAVGAASLWQPLYEVTETREDLQGKEVTVVVDRVRLWAQEWATSEGYRLLWYHRSRKAESDCLARQRQTERALVE